jgi:hypothetical protein
VKIGCVALILLTLSRSVTEAGSAAIACRPALAVFPMGDEPMILEYRKGKPGYLLNASVGVTIQKSGGNITSDSWIRMTQRRDIDR